jgi:hypothetical protein
VALGAGVAGKEDERAGDASAVAAAPEAAFGDPDVGVGLGLAALASPRPTAAGGGCIETLRAGLDVLGRGGTGVGSRVDSATSSSYPGGR